MMEYLKIRNWDKWQTYRKDRGQPPWIKIHRRIRLNPEWVELSDAERGQLVAMWLLAADKDGAIPASAKLIKKLCFLTDPPNLNKFTDLGFIEDGWRQDGVKMASERRPNVTPKAEAEKKREDTNVSFVGQIPFEEIISDLNQKTGRKYKHQTAKYRELIKVRWNDGNRLPDFLYVNQVKSEKWLNDPKYSDFLRPETLYGTKFESYLNEKLINQKPQQQDRICQTCRKPKNVILSDGICTECKREESHGPPLQ